MEPTDSVRELGGASVPFRFDTDAMIYSEDVPALENHLYGLLENQFIRIPPAEEFRKTQTIIAQEVQTNTG